MGDQEENGEKNSSSETANATIAGASVSFGTNIFPAKNKVVGSTAQAQGQTWAANGFYFVPHQQSQPFPSFPNVVYMPQAGPLSPFCGYAAVPQPQPPQPFFSKTPAAKSSE
ncbi:hypothetical protein DMENIID0001_140910 [Sergentomyia squamirostris]